MNFDPLVALNYAAALARPRRVGSGADEAVAAEIEEQLRGWGYQVERQPFTFSTASEVFLKLFILAGVLLISALLIWHERILAVGLLLLVALFLPLNRRVQSAALEQNGRGLKLGQRYTTANLIATRNRVSTTQVATPATGRNPVSNFPHLYLVAHYDSKSQRIPLVLRVALFMLAIIAGLILVALTLFNVSTALYLPIGLLALAAALPLLFLDAGNNSPGAIDNASSVGLVLHLAEVLAQRTDWQAKLGLTLLIPSAEELTLMGSVAYVTAYAQSLREQDRSGGLYVLNFDGVGVDGDLYYVGHSHQPQNSDRINLLAHVRSACVDLNLPLKRFGFVGALFDHIPFAQRGFDAISLIVVGRASRSVHTPNDSIDQLHVRGFDQAGRVTLNVIDRMIG
ncbi:hypothetical protein TFLX_03725 [Thermoflexales bacterium]|nr:hypothetical protein TFLX_03725 [Thermoflexales bacterium]